MMSWTRETFLLSVSNVHARAVSSRVRDGMSGEVLLGFTNGPAAPLTVLGRQLSTSRRSTHLHHPGSSLNEAMLTLAATLPAPPGVTVLPGPMRAFKSRVAALIREHEIQAICYTRGHSDQEGRYVRTVGVWPSEIVAVTYLTDTVDGVKVDPASDIAQVPWEDWLTQLIPDG